MFVYICNQTLFLPAVWKSNAGVRMVCSTGNNLKGFFNDLSTDFKLAPILMGKNFYFLKNFMLILKTDI